MSGKLTGRKGPSADSSAAAPPRQAGQSADRPGTTLQRLPAGPVKEGRSSSACGCPQVDGHAALLRLANVMGRIEARKTFKRDHGAALGSLMPWFVVFALLVAAFILTMR
jgi:hypothetical protein